MKKLLVIALAAFAMVACVNEEVTELPQGDAITFESAFIDNATRAAVDPSTTTATLDGFNVWGFVKEYDGEIFNGTEVEKVGGVWGYEGTQYWVPNQPYYFAALAPMNGSWTVAKATGEDAKKGLGTVSFTNNAGTEDLLYAKTMMTSKDLNEPNGAVKFQFQHLLSKVKFTFKNGFPTSTASIKVTNVKMTAPAEAKINLAQDNYAKAWTDHANTTTLEFGNVEIEKLANTQSAEVANERLTIPAAASQSYKITFDVELFMGAQSVYTVTKTSTVTGYELEMGKAYNFTAEINPDNLDLEDIVFAVESVEGWVSGSDVPAVPVALVNGKNYGTFAEAWDAAVAGGYELKLVENVTLDADNTITLAEGATATLDLNGKTLSLVSNDDTEVTRAAKSGNRVGFDVRGTMTVKNGTVVYKHEGTDMGWGAMVEPFYVGFNGTLNVESATIENLGGSAMAYAVDLVNASAPNGATLNVNNSTLKSSYIAVRVFNNSKTGVNHVNIYDSTLAGKFCFWVHMYAAAGDSYGTDATLDLDILNGTNTFSYTGKAPILYGFANTIYLSESGIPLVDSTETFNEAISEAKDGDVVVLTEGEYTMPSINNKEVTIKGDESVVVTVTSPAMYGADVNFEGVTIKGSGYNTGVQHVNTVTYNGVKVVGAMCLYGEKVVFNNCSFELSGDYIWCYGAKEVEFNNCVFDTTGKALLVYNEGAGANKVTVKDCVFNASAGAKAYAIANQNCAAIEIDNFQSSGVGAAHKVITSGNTYSENFSGEWRIKNHVAGNPINVNGVDYTQIAVDGKLMTIDANRNVTIL